ncbi:MAG TPA: beta-galactosidase, partial [Allosphingosinicella sp.]
AFADRLAEGSAHMLFGPRSGSKTSDFQIPAELPPGLLQDLLPLKVAGVESLRPGHFEGMAEGSGALINWLERVETDLEPRLSTAGGRGVWYQAGRFHYLAGWPDQALMHEILAALAAECRLAVRPLPQGLRLRRHGDVQFAFNYAPGEADIAHLVPRGASLMLGSLKLPPAGVAAWLAG